jgi:NADH-quinone oxidoreductase subunit F
VDSVNIVVGSSRELIASLSDSLGGPSADEVVERLGQDSLADVRAVVSWRGVVAREDACFVSLSLSYLDLVQRESCGRCGPCRIGTDVMRRILRRLAEGDGTPADLEHLRTLAHNIGDSAWCGIGDTVRDPMLALLEAGADHFAAHVGGTVCEEEKTVGWVTAPCRSTCPSNVDCPSYIFQVSEGHPRLAAAQVFRDNPLPSIIGRTCHHPCEINCTLNDVGEPIAINFLKRWAADRDHGIVYDGGERPHESAERTTSPVVGPRAPVTPTGEKVAIVGAGPAGLSAAYYLARNGHRPTIFEALPVPGGMLWVGIPEYRLPKAVLRREVENIERAGVEIRYGQAVGRELAFSDLDEMGFAGTFIAIGAHSGKKLRIPGEELPGSVDAIDFLRRVALGEPVELGERVLVIGGGNSAMDAARTSVRLGAKEVTVVYRRAREQMPANPWEIEEAEEEGVHFRLLSAPLRCEGDTCVETLVCQPMELGPPDDSGRRSPVAVDCEPFVMKADTLIAAVGQQPDFAPFADDSALALNKWGYLDCDPRTFMTTKPGVFVGGDAITGGASVIEAIYAGKQVAKYMDCFLRGEEVVEDLEDKTKRVAVYLGAQQSRYPLADSVSYGRRELMPLLAPDVRRRSFAATELGFTDAQAFAESKRCLRCHRPLIVAGVRD